MTWTARHIAGVLMSVLGMLVGAPTATGEAGRCSRIISLAPSITETLFSLNLGDSVVGVTRYCQFPPQAQQISKVGGFLDPSYEAIVALRPTITLLLREQHDQRKILERLGIAVLEVDHRSLAGIHTSIATIGSYCARTEEAERLVQGLVHDAPPTRATTNSEPPPVLIAIGGSENDSNLSSLYISGNDGFYNDLLRLAGARNLFEKQTVSFPMLSREGIIALNPKIIIQIVSPTEGLSAAPEKILAAWATLDMIDAVKQKRVYVFTQDYASIPSPRYPLLLRDLIRVIHGS